MDILVVMKVDEKHKKVLADAAPDANIRYISAGEVTKEDAVTADVIVGNIAPDMLKDCSKLKLMQLNSAGTDGYTAEGVLPQGATLANATGAYGLAIAEHMLGVLLTMMKKIVKYRIEQENQMWSDHGSVTSVFGSKTLIVGLGDIGSEFAIRMNALGSNVTAIKRNATSAPEYVSELYQMDKLYECLENADIVATCLPGTKETYKIFNAEAFAHMKKGAFFINVGRGNAVDSDALCDALESGYLAGAALDVTDPEPLPAGHRLWNAPGILITPHVSGGYHLQETHDRIINIAARNIGHLLNDEPFENEVDMELGYRKLVSNEN